MFLVIVIFYNLFAYSLVSKIEYILTILKFMFFGKTKIKIELPINPHKINERKEKINRSKTKRISALKYRIYLINEFLNSRILFSFFF